MRNVYFNVIKDHLSVPIIGHSFGCYKGKGYVYGGKSADIMNELTILNLRDFRFT
jgi:hypothetical protein